MEERRKLERFELNVPARITMKSGINKIEEYHLSTRDLSSAGAYLYSNQALPKGACVRMEFLIGFDTLEKIAGDKGRAKVRVRGQVIRSSSEGIAVRFDSKYKITTLENNSLGNGPS